MKASRVSRFIKERKGKIQYDKKLKLHYLELFVEPSGDSTKDPKQKIRLGIDPGSCFDGFSVVSKDSHHENFELVQRPKKGYNAIKSFKSRQSMNRRTRRSRLWHRPIRFDNRNSKKLAPTIRANNDFRKWLIKKICFYYPIAEVELEDVRFDHHNNTNGKSFSHVEQGKNDMMDFIRKDMKLMLTLTAGCETAKYRKSLNNGADVKIKDKSSKEFNAHCIDSYILACIKGYPFDEKLGDFDFSKKQIKYAPQINTRVVYIEKIVKVRRCLTRTRKRYVNLCRYYKQRKGDIKEYYVNMSSHRNLCRVKPEGVHSNHPKKWTYIDNGFVERFKCNTARYGGTRVKGKSYFINNEWHNRKIDVRYG